MDSKETLLSYIKENLDILDKYDLGDIKKKINQSLIVEKLHVYFDNDLFGNVINKDNVFDLSLDFKENEKRFNLWVNQNFGSKKTFYDYYYCKTIFKSYHFRSKNGNYYSSSDMIISIFFQFMIFLIKNEKHENLAKANELADKYTQKIQNIWQGCYVSELGIYVKFYKNGRTDIKGLSEEQETKIEYLYQLSRKRIKLPNRDYFQDFLK